MFKPNELRRTAAIVLLIPISALAGLSSSDSQDPASARTPGASQTARSAGGYQLRCWQYGRLLFEEYLAALPTDSARNAPKIVATDRHGRPIHVAEIDSATCLIRSANGERGAAK